MSRAPFMKLFFGDLVGDTTHLSDAEFGSYVLLLGAMWNAGGYLPADPTRLARIARCSARRWPARWAVLEPFMILTDDGKVTQQRLLSERISASETSLSRAASGSRGGNAKAWKVLQMPLANAVAKGVAKPKQLESTARARGITPIPLAGDVPPSEPNGSRLPEGWSLDDVGRQFAAKLGLASQVIELEADKFGDYWRGRAGQGGRKKDWPATWRNWARRAAEDRGLAVPDADTREDRIKARLKEAMNDGER